MKRVWLLATIAVWTTGSAAASPDFRDGFNLDHSIIAINGDICNIDSSVGIGSARKQRADHDIALPVTLGHQGQEAACQLLDIHAPNLLITALRYRQLYTFQNQFVSRIEFSCLRDAPTSTSVTHFGSISSPSPLVLSTYGPCTLSPRSGIPETGATAQRRFTQKP